MSEKDAAVIGPDDPLYRALQPSKECVEEIARMEQAQAAGLTSLHHAQAEARGAQKERAAIVAYLEELGARIRPLGLHIGDAPQATIDAVRDAIERGDHLQERKPND